MATTTTTTTSRVNLSDKIREALEEEIVTGKLYAGCRIDEQELMERFDVSRTPAREAIQQLATAGLVEMVPRHGAVVATLSLTEYVAMLEMLTELEGLAARLSARRMPAALRKDLQASLHACEEAATQDDSVAYEQANRWFHETIYDGSLNEVLAGQLRRMRLRMRHPQRSLFDRPNRVRNSLAEHRDIMKAILDGDEDAADRHMCMHISSGGNVYVDAVARGSIPRS
jgi:DNA-binding GntR family transcriptional regulator